MINDNWKIRAFQLTHLGRSIFHLPFHLSFVFLIALNLLASPALVMHLPTDARAIHSSRVPFLSVLNVPQSTPAVQRVAVVGMTVSDMNRSVEYNHSYPGLLNELSLDPDCSEGIEAV